MAVGKEDFNGRNAINFVEYFLREQAMRFQSPDRLAALNIADQLPELLEDQGYFGTEAIEVLENFLQRDAGVHVRFVVDESEKKLLTEKDIQFAQHHAERFIQRPHGIVLNDEEIPFTLMNFTSLFRNELCSTIHPFKNFQDPKPWYRNEPFATQEGMAAPISFITSNPLSQSQGLDCLDQQQLILLHGASASEDRTAFKNARWRTPLEAVWDTVLLYMNTGEHSLHPYADRIPARFQGSSRFLTVRFEPGRGITVNRDNGAADSRIGVYAVRTPGF